MPESPLPPATPRSNRTSGVPSPMSGGPGGNATGASTPGSRLSDRAAAFESPSKAAQALRAGQIPDEGYERQLRAVALLAEMLVLEDMNYAPEPLASSRVVPFEMLSTNPCMAMLSSYDTQLVYHALQVTQNLTLETDRDTGALWVGSVVEGCWPTNATAVVHLGVTATTPLDEVMGVVQQYTKQHIWVIWLGPMTVGAQDATWYLGFSCGAAAVAALRDLTPLQFVEVRDGSRVSFRAGPKQTSARSQSRINASFAYLGKIIHTVAPRRVQPPGPRSNSPVTTTRRARSAGRRPWTPTQLPARSSSAQPRSTSRRSRSATAKPVANADANDARQNTTASNNDANNNQPLRVMKRRQAEPPAPLTDAVAPTPPPDPRLPSAKQSAPPQVMPQGYVSRRAASLEQRFNGGHAAPPHAETTGHRPPVVTRVNRPYAVGAHTVTNASGDARSDVARSDVSTAASRQRRPPSRNCTVPSIQSATAHWFHWWWWGAAQRYGYLLDQDSWAFEAPQQQPPPTRQISTTLNARNVRRESAVSVTEDGSQVKIRRRRFRNKKTAESAAGLPPSTEPINKSWADEPTSVPGIDDVPTPSGASEGEHAADVQPPTTTATGVEEGAHQASPSPPVEAEPAPPAAPKLSFADMIRQRNTNRPATAPEKAAQVTSLKGVTDDVRNTNGPRNGGTAPQQLRDAASAKSKPAAKSSRVAQRA